MPFSLRRAFGAPGVIGRASGVAALYFVVGSTVAGRALGAAGRAPLDCARERRVVGRDNVDAAPGIDARLRPLRRLLRGVRVLGVAATTAIEERGAELARDRR